jgi:hypothetical protein
MQGIRCFVENTTNGLAYGILANHQVHFDIPYAFPGLNNCGSVLYGDATGDDASGIASETSLTPSMTVAKFLVQSLEGAVSALVTMLTCPYPLIEAFVAHRTKAGFFAPNANQFRAPFLSLKPLNGHLLHRSIEFKGFGFVGMALRRLALRISSAVTTCCGSSI